MKNHSPSSQETDTRLPLVSIVIITYNSARFVKDTLESVGNQTYLGPMELIVSDDCSSDDTLEVCRSWIAVHADRFTRASVIRTPRNTGICGNYNFALRHINGEWIKYIAGDDMLMPRSIERFVAIASVSPDRFYISGIDRFQGAQGPWYPMGTYLDCRSADQQAYNLAMHAGGGIVSGPAFFIHAGLLKELGGMDMQYPMLEDFPFAFRCAFTGHHITIIRESLVRYRVYGESMSNSGDKFNTMYHRAIYQARKDIALRQRRYLWWWHNSVMKLLSRPDECRGFMRSITESLLKCTDVYAWAVKVQSLVSSSRPRELCRAVSWRGIRHVWHR